MDRLFKLVIGYDGSPCSDATLDDLRRDRLPKRVDAVVVTVADVFPPPEDELAGDDVLSPAALALVARSQAEAMKAVKHALSVAEQGAHRVKTDFPGWEVDRKSTRLNSSHSQISYAVFCLKKK